TYFRRGFGLKKEIEPLLAAEYHSALVEELRAQGNVRTFGDLTIRLANAFGFCYGVDRAVDYAYQTTVKFPGRRIFLVGEIIHNPHVNQRLKDAGITFLYPGAKGSFDFSMLQPEDVVILPAFGVTMDDLEHLKRIGCVLVDTTCGSVLNVWKRVESYARDRFTAVIHGKYFHEETRATASQVNTDGGGTYLVVRDMAEARLVCDYIEQNERALSRAAFRAHFEAKSSAGFDPDLDLTRVGVANQTTMLASESLAIAAEIGKSMALRYGPESLADHFRSFDTICSATQERQDAVLELMQDPPDIMIVIGGYNSSNTNHLAHLCREYTTTYHIADATCIDPAQGTIRHKAELAADAPEVSTGDWLSPGPISLGLTAGASTPNNKIGETIERILQTRQLALAAVSGQDS
ncbi:MAG TPA: 4-hydroxy-3-methylbut-2-enyl diphosphate reductase, partial [Longimicrobiales bacterium]|nr:4-hydroxy-3-methylbut-2-enyl diphosphate reductase [Longimicrobiales bacterium]